MVSGAPPHLRGGVESTFCLAFGFSRNSPLESVDCFAMSPLIQTDERTVRYDEAGRSVHFEISLQCCGGIQFVLHTFPPPDHWDREVGEERIPIEQAEYKEIVRRTRQALEYLKLDFAVD